MSESNFELILQELQQEQEIMEILEAENRALRQQLADLREGRGIIVEIEGSRFALTGEASSLPAPAESLPTMQMAAITAEQEEAPAVATQETPGDANQQSPVEEEEAVVAEMPLEMQPTMSFLLEDDEPVTAFPFLEDTIEEEASTIATSKMAIWGESPSTPFPPITPPQPPVDTATEPIQKPVQTGKLPPAPINEDEKAALRRELIGSFLLE